MSIDIQLHIKRAEPTEADKAIELLRAHGFDQFADEIEARHEHGDVRVFDKNVGGSLEDLAISADLYQYIWRPDEIGIDKASQLLGPLITGYQRLKEHKTWSVQYDRLCCLVSEYIIVCGEHPDATVTVWR